MSLDLNTENYMIYIAFLQLPDLKINKIKKKKDRPTNPSHFQVKRANKPLLF